jgi:hypothetical protein
MKVMMMRMFYALFISFVLVTTVWASDQDEAWKRMALSAQAFPNQAEALYIDIPVARSGVSNFMMRAFIGKASWMRQLTDLMARGANSPTYLVIGSQDNAVAYSALSKAFDSFKDGSLPELHLALIGSPEQAGRLRPAVEALGAEYRVLLAPLRN